MNEAHKVDYPVYTGAMRFLCLHGRGTNVKILKMQTAWLRFHLQKQGHTFSFLEGNIPHAPAPEIAGMLGGIPNAQACFSYIDMQSPNTCQDAGIGLAAYIAEYGPFDAVMAFSEGAGVAATFILSQALRGLSPFKMAVFFCGGIPADPAALERGMIRLLVPEHADAYRINIPTIHAYGENDPRKLNFGVYLSYLCQDDAKIIITHRGGHEIPGRRMDGEVRCILGAIEEVASKIETKMAGGAILP